MNKDYLHVDHELISLLLDRQQHFMCKLPLAATRLYGFYFSIYTPKIPLLCKQKLKGLKELVELKITLLPRSIPIQHSNHNGSTHF